MVFEDSAISSATELNEITTWCCFTVHTRVIYWSSIIVLAYLRITVHNSQKPYIIQRNEFRHATLAR